MLEVYCAISCVSTSFELSSTISRFEIRLNVTMYETTCYLKKICAKVYQRTEDHEILITGHSTRIHEVLCDNYTFKHTLGVCTPEYECDSNMWTFSPERR